MRSERDKIYDEQKTGIILRIAADQQQRTVQKLYSNSNDKPTENFKEVNKSNARLAAASGASYYFNR